MEENRNKRLLLLLYRYTCRAHEAWQDWCSHICRETGEPLDKWNRRRERVQKKILEVMDGKDIGKGEK